MAKCPKAAFGSLFKLRGSRLGRFGLISTIGPKTICRRSHGFVLRGLSEVNMNYVPFHVGDWDSSTRLLAPVEKGVYIDLLMLYYSVERPLMRSECERIARAYSTTEREALSYVLERFFVPDGESYRHVRCDEEIAKYQDKAEKASKSAKARWSKRKRELGTDSGQAFELEPQCERNTNVMRTHEERNANQEPITNNQVVKEIKKEKPKKTTASKTVKPDDVSEEVWTEWSAHRKRKKAAMSDLVIKELRKEAEMAGLSLQEVMTIQVMNGWQGFKASWLTKDGVKGIPSHKGELTQEERIKQGYGYDW